jgi:protein JSN1
MFSVITQTSEPAASSTLISAIFISPNDQTLLEILSDANNGSQVIGKILAISTLPKDEKDKMIEAVRRALPSIKASSTPPYRLLLEVVGLPVPAGSINSSPFGRSGGQGWSAQAQAQGQLGGMGYYPYQQPIAAGSGPYGGLPVNPGLSPLLIPIGGGPARPGSPNPNGSPRTPQPRQRGRLSPGSQMMSPGSDPFNPVSQLLSSRREINCLGREDFRASSNRSSSPRRASTCPTSSLTTG